MNLPRCQARKQDIMRLTQQAVTPVTVAIVVLALAATTALASPARSTAQVMSAPIKVVATIPVGVSPYGVAANPAKKTIYVANSFFNTVSVIATIRVGQSPHGVAADPRTKT